MKCRHTWHAISAVEKSRTNTHAVMEYTQECPACGYTKTTVREVQCKPSGYAEFQLVVRAMRSLDRKGLALANGMGPIAIDQLWLTKK